jgi:flagellar protein FliO/FliZ
MYDLYKIGFYLGGEELKTSLFIMLFTGVWFLVDIPTVLAQEIAEQGELSEEFQFHDPRAEEKNYLFNQYPANSFNAEGTANSSSIWVIIRMILVLIMAAAAVYGVVFFIKRSSRQPSESNPFLKILASVHLGSNRYTHIVAVGSKVWLLGSCDGGVNLIGEVDDKDIINAMLLEDSRKISEASNRFPDFLSILRRFGTYSESRSSAADDIRKRRERLKGL